MAIAGIDQRVLLATLDENDVPEYVHTSDFASGGAGGSGGLTDAQLRAAAVPVSGPVTDAQLRATAVPVSGPLTDTELRATAIPISGALTDAQLRATAVPVSGPLTDAQLRAAAVPVGGTVAHDGIDSGNPQKIGYKAIAHGAAPTAVAAGDRSDAYANRHGVPWVIGGHPNVVTIRANYTAAQTDTAIVTASAGEKIVVTRCSIMADKANTVDVAARVGFGATNTPTGVGVVASHPGIAAGSGVVEGSGAGELGVGADGEDLRITSEVPTTGSIDVVVTYYIVPS